AYTDHEIGRVLDAIDKLGKLDNTLIIYISGDNGASAEGTILGTPSEIISFNGLDVPVADQLKDFYDAWGSDQTYPHYAVGWSWAFATPYKWMKQIPSFFGGTRNGMAISWPARITDKGGIRTQFHHVIDIVPTLLEVTGIPAPVMVDGVAQKPIEGVSLAYTFDKADADAPSPHKLQYFEMAGVQGLYNDGWMLSAVPLRPPWNIVGKAIEDPATAYKFELYDLRKDWTQYTDVAAQNPVKVQEMRDLMFGQFAKYQVLPLDASALTRMVTARPNPAGGVSSSGRRRSQRRQLRRAQGCAGSLPGRRLATVGEPRQARRRRREGRARRAWTEGRSRIERRDDSRLENRSRALRRNARDFGRPRGSGARIARAVRAVLNRGGLGHFAERALWNRPRRSLHLDVGRPDHLAPLLRFVSDELSKVGGGTREHRSSQVGEAFLHVGIGKSGI